MIGRQLVRLIICWNLRISGSKRYGLSCDDSCNMPSPSTSTCRGDYVSCVCCFIFLGAVCYTCLLSIGHLLFFFGHLCFHKADACLFWIIVLIKPFDASKGLNKSLIENSAITLGRLAWVCPELVSPHMGHFMQQWCIALSM